MKLNAITLAALGSISTFNLAQVAPIGSGPVLTGPQGYIGLPNAPHVPATKADPAFPVQAYIVDTQWEMSSDGPYGQGRGNLLNDKQTGFEFTYSCNQPFLNSQRSSIRATGRSQARSLRSSPRPSATTRPSSAR